jgi:uncharacterized sulfatase
MHSRLLLLGLLSACWLVAAERPNFLIIIADDCTYSDLGFYGGQNAYTPNLDRLAGEGMIFDKAYLSIAMCNPCRSELYSGRYPMNNGCAWNHAASRPNLKTMPQLLREHGYRVGLAGKTHIKPKSTFPFASVDGFEKSCVAQRTKDCNLDPAKAFMTEDGPFCLVIGLTEPHRPWTMGDAKQYPVNELKLPPHIADTEVTREKFAAYLAEITYMDDQVGQIMKALRDSGKGGNTLVLFTSEQGSQFPGCKWTNYDAGVHTALIARKPAMVRKGSRTKALVQYADVLPTLLDLAGAPAFDELDGRSFAPVLRGETDKHRDYVYTMHNNVPEGTPYPIRSVTDGTYHYVRNLLPEETYYEKHMMNADYTLYWPTWESGARTDARTKFLVDRYLRRPPVELFNLETDKHEMTNLATNPEYGPTIKKLGKVLDDWMTAQGDPGKHQDSMQALTAARQEKHLFGPHRPDAVNNAEKLLATVKVPPPKKPRKKKK